MVCLNFIFLFANITLTSWTQQRLVSQYFKICMLSSHVHCWKANFVFFWVSYRCENHLQSRDCLDTRKFNPTNNRSIRNPRQCRMSLESPNRILHISSTNIVARNEVANKVDNAWLHRLRKTTLHDGLNSRFSSLHTITSKESIWGLINSRSRYEHQVQSWKNRLGGESWE